MQTRQRIPAIAAVAMVEGHCGGSKQAKQLLADKLRDGSISAAAHLVWRSNFGNSVSPKSRDFIVEEPLIAAAEWQSSGDWEADCARWDWLNGRFMVRRSAIRPISLGGMGYKWTVAENVSFCPRELGLVTKALQNKRYAPGGAPGKLTEWHVFWLELVRLAQAGKLNDREFPTLTSLRKHFLDNERFALSDESIKPHVSRVWEHIIAARSVEELLHGSCLAGFEISSK